MKANLIGGISFLDFWVLHGVILVSFELVTFSFKFVGNSSLSNSNNGGGWDVVVMVRGGGIVDEGFGAVLLLLMSVWCLLVSRDKR